LAISEKKDESGVAWPNLPYGQATKVQ